MAVYPYARNDDVWKDEINFYHIPMHPDEMANPVCRTKTFDFWPRSAPDIAEELADDGFYYTGRGDTVTCYACGQSLDRWTEQHKPRTRHLEVSPKCYAARGLTSGPRSLHCDSSKSYTFSGEKQLNDGSSSCKSKLAVDGCSVIADKRILSNERLQEKTDLYDGTEEERRVAISMKSIQQLGFSVEDVQEACKLLKGDKKEVNTDSLLDTIYDIQKENEKSNCTLKSGAKSCVKNIPTGSENTPTKVIQPPKEQSKPRKSTSTGKRKEVSPHLAKEIEKEKDRLQRLIAEARDRGLCRVCGVRDACVLYLPCAHKVACPDCTETRVHCPVETCGKIIRGTKQVYYA